MLFGELLSENKILRKLQQRFKSDKHYISTIKVNRIALNNNEHKRMQALDCRKCLKEYFIQYYLFLA